ncbi:MAG: hypothetical protein Fur002_16760 [Anaerolineales bacterium]
MFQKILRGLEILLTLTLVAWAVNSSAPSLADPLERVRAYTRDSEFNYLAWMSSAAWLKLQASAANSPYVFHADQQRELVLDYFRITQDVLRAEYELEKIYADPSVTDKAAASESLRAELDALQARHDALAPLAESVLQEQVTTVLAEEGLTALGQPVPNVWFHATPLPLALIVSPRDKIEQSANISLQTDLAVDEQAALEARVDAGLNVSSLVVHVGGVGVYPTMVMRTMDLNWMTTVIAHEWIHNYLTLRPLGMRYETLRTMNETTASIAGDEIGAKVILRFYPELAAAPAAHASALNFASPASQPLYDAFDFNAAMRETRVHVDALLGIGKVEEAERYMEARRLVFLQNGYTLRKINQAYFAFYGAYADSPGGAAGEDPIGAAVRKLRAQSPSLAQFIHTMARMKRVEDLYEAVKFNIYLSRLP